MTQFMLLGISFVVGIALRRLRVMPEHAPSILNAFIINVSLPAVTLLYLHDLRIDPNLFAPAAMPWLFFISAFFVIRMLARLKKWDDGTVGCLLMTAGLGNTSFVGLPMIEAYYGPQAIGIGLVADQAGSFMVVSTLGFLAAARYSSSNLNATAQLKKVILFPPFLAAIVAFLTQPLEYHPAFRAVLARLGDTLTPIALISVGMQLHLSSWNESAGPLVLGLLLKLLILPAWMLLIFAGLLRMSGETMQVTIFEAAMPPMITGGIIAIEHRLNPKLATLMVGIGIPLSFLTLAAWWWLLDHF